MASLYQRNKTFWITYIDNGRKISRSLRTKDKKAATFLKNQIENKLALGHSPLPDNTKSALEAFQEFKQYREGRLSLKHCYNDHYRIERFIKDSNIIQIRNITEESLKKHLDERIKGGISNQTANHTIRCVKTFLNFCLKQKYVQENLISRMPKYPIDQKEPRYLTKEETQKLLSIAEGSVIYLPIAIALFTGMRQGEILRLLWQDIDFKFNNITVHISKTKKFRKVPLHAKLRKILEQFKKPNGLVFDKSLRILEWEFSKLKRLMPKETKPFRFHDLRHTFASLMIRSGVDILTVSKLLGHADVKTTQIYSHLYQDHIQESMSKLDI